MIFSRIILILLVALNLPACGGGNSSSSSSGQNPPPTQNPEPEPEPEPTPAALVPDRISDPTLPRPGHAEYAKAQAAVRFLMQATFGPNAKSVKALMDANNDYATWINIQMALPQTRHLPLLEDRFAEIGFERAPVDENTEDGWVRDLQRSDIWWESAIWGQDQLRQRVAYALSQIFVISNVSDALFDDSRGIANYHDILAEHAFGNYRDLLEVVTLNPIMGEYLSMIRNQKADPEKNIRPDENYAREVMQLFSIGLAELNIDGSMKLDHGAPIPTYGQDDIKALARVFTGWYHGNISNWWEYVTGGDSEILPMKAFNAQHDFGEKTLFGNNIIPANLSPAEDLDAALDILFAHDNVAPFISKQLIQRLVTSNPSPDYVERVAGVFNDNGKGVKGDLGAVIKTILLDSEAREGDVENFGKIKEPMLKAAALWRAFKAQGSTVREQNGYLSHHRLRYRGSDREYGQRPYGSFSVFNFYRPDYQFPGEIKQSDLLSPEMQIHTESQLASSTNALSGTIYWRDEEGSWPKSEEAGYAWDLYPSQLYLQDEKNLADDGAALLDKANLLLMAGQMSSPMYNEILSFLNTIPDSSENKWTLSIYDTLYLICISPEFAVQR